MLIELGSLWQKFIRHNNVNADLMQVRLGNTNICKQRKTVHLKISFTPRGGIG